MTREKKEDFRYEKPSLNRLDEGAKGAIGSCTGGSGANPGSCGSGSSAGTCGAGGGPNFG